jgi:flagellar hook-associated protein 2
VLNKRLATLQARYTKEFNALDGLLSQLQGTSNFLTQQLSRLPGSAPLLRRDR